MKTAVGVFSSLADAERSVEELRRAGIPEKRVNLLTPRSSEQQVEAVPTTETEQPGMGKAIGGVVGGVAGATAGMGLAAAAATLLVPGLGAVAAVELAAGALLGAGGAIGGAAAGGALENRMSGGLPKDELYLYEDALRHGRSVVFVLAQDEEEAERARHILSASGAETLDAAREQWWVGIRDDERAHYEGSGGRFEDAEQHYRRGFEAALHPEVRGKGHREAGSWLKGRYGADAERREFAAGYERGAAHARRLSHPGGSAPAARE